MVIEFEPFHSLSIWHAQYNLLFYFFYIFILLFYLLIPRLVPVFTKSLKVNNVTWYIMKPVLKANFSPVFFYENGPKKNGPI